MKSATRSDAEIQEDVRLELEFDARVRATDIGVRVKHGVASLYGTVASLIERDAASAATQRVHGVRAVANELDIRLFPEAVRTDDEIAGAIAQAFLWDAAVPVHVIQITVVDGRVTLTGEVTGHHQREEAGAVARRIVGVRAVLNHIGVIPAPTATDVKQKITSALLRNAALDARQIGVHVDDNIVTLTGNARTWAEKDDAQSAAWSIPGVTEIKNEIVIVPTPR